MADEESFVILHCSPMSSLESQRNGNSIGRDGDNPIDCVSFLQENGVANENASISTQIDKSLHIDTPSISNTSLETNGVHESKNSSMKNSVNLPPDQKNDVMNGSVATSFILGQTKSDEVKQANIYSQFPSLSKQASAEEVSKLQSLICENIQIKNTLNNAELIIHQYYAYAQQNFQEFRTMIQTIREENKLLRNKVDKFDGLQHDIEKLKDDNKSLHKELEDHNAHLATTTELYQTDVAQLQQKLSEKDALIGNMRHYVTTLEDKNVSAVYITQDVDDERKTKQLQEHQEAIEEMNRKMLELVQENQDLKIQLSLFEDEVGRFKKNAKDDQVLLEEARGDISMLQAKDIDKDQMIKEMRSEILALQTQLKVYRDDFEMERQSRQEIAGEKDQLLQDLKAIQRRNQQLTQENEKQAQALMQSHAPNSMSSISSQDGAVGGIKPVKTSPAKETPTAKKDTKPSNEETSQYRCPVCSKGFNNTSVLHSHVNDCLDKI